VCMHVHMMLNISIVHDLSDTEWCLGDIDIASWTILALSSKSIHRTLLFTHELFIKHIMCSP
jgi:hypothetical protein